MHLSDLVQSFFATLHAFLAVEGCVVALSCGVRQPPQPGQACARAHKVRPSLLHRDYVFLDEWFSPQVLSAIERSE